jgi:hypothetical protein
MVSAYRVGSLASKDRMLARHMDQPAHPAPLAYLELRLPSLRLPAPRVIVVSMITGSLMKPVGCLVLAMNPRRTNTGQPIRRRHVLQFHPDDGRLHWYTWSVASAAAVAL